MPSLRRLRAVRRLAGPVAVALLGAACRPSAVYAPPEWTQGLERDAGFDSAAPLDATRVVFTYGDGGFRFVAPDPLWGRGHRQYVHDEHAIGIYDLTTDTARVLHADRRDRLSDGNGAITIASARGGFALVLRERTTEKGVMIAPGGWSLVDLESGALEPVALEAELSRLQHELSAAPALIDDAGALLLVAHRSGLSARGVEHPHHFLRRRSGEILDLGVGELLGDLHGWVFLARPSRTGADAVEAQTGWTQRLSAAELAAHRSALRKRPPGGVRVSLDRQTLHVTTEAGPAELHLRALL